MLTHSGDRDFAPQGRSEAIRKVRMADGKSRAIARITDKETHDKISSQYNILPTRIPFIKMHERRLKYQAYVRVADMSHVSAGDNLAPPKKAWSGVQRDLQRPRDGKRQRRMAMKEQHTDHKKEVIYKE
jgi:hypothetical protein